MTAININGTAIAFGMVMQRADKPPEAHVAKIGDGRADTGLPRQRGHRKIPVGKTELVRWKSKDGREIEGLLTYPSGYTAGARVPLILNIHGAAGRRLFTELYWRPGVYPLATFAARGYAILRRIHAVRSGYGPNFAARTSKTGAAATIRT